MCVSAQFCEQHLLLLFRILESSRDPVVRSNIVIALGDIAVCFGSLIDDVSYLPIPHEPSAYTQNSERLYQGLSDPDPLVKKNTLMVLTHLILNGMIKVKGQLGEMAKCLEDADPRISDLAKLFFTELSTKDNALYNNLQDVISHLSVGKHKVGEEEFERVMRFIFTFIEKVSLCFYYGCYHESGPDGYKAAKRHRWVLPTAIRAVGDVALTRACWIGDGAMGMRLSSDNTGQAGRIDCRKAVSAFQDDRRRATVAGSCVLSVVVAFQEREEHEAAH